MYAEIEKALFSLRRSGLRRFGTSKYAEGTSAPCDNLPINLRADENTQHTLWGTTDVNDRGQEGLDYCIERKSSFLQ